MTTELRERRRLPLLDATVLTVAVGLAVLPLVPVYGPSAIAAPALGGLLLGGGLAWFAARRGWGVLVTAAVTLSAYLLLGTALAAPTLAFARVLPSPESLVLLLTGTLTVWKQVLTLDPALGSSGNLLVAPYLLALVGSAVGVGVAVRVRSARATWAALVPLGVLGVAVLLGTKVTVQPAPAGVALVLGLLVWASWRVGSLARRRVVSLAVLLAVTAVAGGLAGPVLGEQRPRFVLRDEIVPPFDPRDHPSPLSVFRKFVKDWEETELVTVRGLPEDAVVRLATLDAFDGVVWNVAGSEAAEGSGSFRRVGETIATSVRGESTTVELEVHDLPMVWLPTVGYAERFDFAGPRATDLSADLRYNDATGTAVLTGGVPAGTRWTVRTVVPEQPSDDALGAAQAGAVTLPAPDGVPDAVPLFAGELAGTASTPALIARTLEQGLAERGWFSHGIEANDDYPSLSGHGADRLTTLLTGELMVGDGEQYASAMALMAREMGLPARVVLALAPPDPEDGEVDGARAGDAEITFTGADVEAYVEIAFAGHGWVLFDPTPPESKTPDEDTPEETSEPQPQVMQPPPPPEDPVTPPDDDTEQPRTEDTEEQIDEPWFWAEVIRAVAVVGIPLILLVLPFMLINAAKRRRRERRRTAGPTVGRVAGGWDEVLDHARDLRRPPPETATRREAAVHLARAFAAPDRTPGEERLRRTGRVGAPVAGLAAGADALIFGPGEPSDAQVEAYWREVDAAVGAMRAAVPWRRRVRAQFSLVSLRARRRAAREARG